jgi:hypothetical protein
MISARRGPMPLIARLLRSFCRARRLNCSVDRRQAQDCPGDGRRGSRRDDDSVGLLVSKLRTKGHDLLTNIIGETLKGAPRRRVFIEEEIRKTHSPKRPGMHVHELAIAALDDFRAASAYVYDQPIFIGLWPLRLYAQMYQARLLCP